MRFTVVLSYSNGGLLASVARPSQNPFISNGDGSLHKLARNSAPAAGGVNGGCRATGEPFRPEYPSACGKRVFPTSQLLSSGSRKAAVVELKFFSAAKSPMLLGEAGAMLAHSSKISPRSSLSNGSEDDSVENVCVT